MPTVLRIGPYRFYFYSHEPNEPPHIHIDRDKLTAKFWLKQVSLAASIGFSAKVAGNSTREPRNFIGGLEWVFWRFEQTRESDLINDLRSNTP